MTDSLFPFAVPHKPYLSAEKTLYMQLEFFGGNNAKAFRLG